jgi:hypothetical protein
MSHQSLLGIITKFLGRVILYAQANENFIREEIKSKFESRNASYYSVQNFIAAILLSNNIQIKIYRAIILPVGMYGNETWSPALREESKLRMFENRMVRKICELNPLA